MKIYKATKSGSIITGSVQQIATALSVSRAAVNYAKIHKTKCKGYTIEYDTTVVPQKRKSTRRQLSIAIELLKRSRLIIDDENKDANDRNEYGNIGIVEDIDRFLLN